MHTTVLSLLTQKREKFGPQVALETSHVQLTYSELFEKADLLANQLHRPNGQQVVLVMCESGVGHVISLLAAIKSNQVFMPVDSNISSEKLDELLIDFKVNTILVDHQLKSRLAGKTHPSGEILKIVGLDESGVIQNPEPCESPIYSDQTYDEAYIYHTSGSTGKPNAILGSHRSLVHFVQWEIQQFGITSGSRFSQLMRPTFDASLRDILVPLCSGGTVVIPEQEFRDNALVLDQWIHDKQITHVHTVPSLMRVLLEEGTSDFGSLKYMFVSGEMLYVKDARQWNQKVNQAKLVNFYGPTETTMIKCFYEVDDLPGKVNDALPVGKPMADTRIAVVNDGLMCPVGEIGEVFIKTDYMTKGYVNQPALNDARFVANPITGDTEDRVYRTGDLGRFSAEGNLEIIGRLDSQVKINGVRLELEEINRAAMGIYGVDQAYTVAEKNENLVNELICFYSGTCDENQIKLQLAKVLDRAIVPGHLVKLDQWPLNLNGKINRKKLPGLMELKCREVIKEDLNPSEQGILDIWKEVLGLPSVSKHVSFFKVGGTSLRAIQVISRVFKRFEIRLTVQDLFRHDTIEQLAGFIEKGQDQQYQQIPVLPEGVEAIASPAQRQLWIAQQFDETVSAFNIVNAWQLEGNLNKAGIQHALQEILKRHEILRTTFRYKDEELRCYVDEGLVKQIQPEWIDFSNLDYSDEAVQQVLNDGATEHMDLTYGPLLKLRMIQLKDQKTICLMLIHHIISDGWSINILLKELGVFYNAYVKKEKPSLEPLQLQFKDINVWKQNQMSEDKLSQTKKYWLSELEDRTFTRLPVGGDRPATHSFSGKTLEFVLDGDLSENMLVLREDLKVTSFMFLLAVTDLLLYVFSGREDQVLGVPHAGRDHEKMENQLGYYVNILPVRLTIDPNWKFVDFLRNVGEKVTEGTNYSDWPMDGLVEELKLPLYPDTNMLYDVVVQMQNTEMSNYTVAELADLEVKEVAVPNYSSKFDLTFNFIQNEQSVSGSLEYNADLFREEAMNGLLEKFRQLISKVTENPDLELRAIYEQFVSRSSRQKEMAAAFTGKMNK